jgi:glucose-6-phosphate isomerase
MYLPYDVKVRDEVKKAAVLIREKFENFVVLGIGGSALGTIAVHRAMKHPFYNLLPDIKRKAPRLFVLDNVDPETAMGIFDVIDLKKTCINIISKSGETAETAAFMKLFWKKYTAVVKDDRLKDHIIITTDKEKGALRPIVNKYGLVSFVVPSNVGGRFSVLTPVGLLPLAVTGVNIDELLKGAAYMDTMVSNADVWKNPAYMRAVMHYISDVKFRRKIDVMMPYSNALKDTADWYAQLWAESTGKKLNNEGRTVNCGLTPVKALGTTDQHSQVQLYVEGPLDKVVTFIKAESFREDAEIPNNFDDVDTMAYLSGQKMSKLLNAEESATETALTKNQRANMTITMPEISEFTMGQLIYMLEVETAFMGELYDINAFDQPGVETGKTAAFALMGRKGYKERIKELSNGKSIAKYII